MTYKIMPRMSKRVLATTRTDLAMISLCLRSTLFRYFLELFLWCFNWTAKNCLLMEPNLNNSKSGARLKSGFLQTVLASTKLWIMYLGSWGDTWICIQFILNQARQERPKKCKNIYFCDICREQTMDWRFSLDFYFASCLIVNISRSEWKMNWSKNVPEQIMFNLE